MTSGRFNVGFHDQAVEVPGQMLPFRFGVYAAVSPTMSAWRDQSDGCLREAGLSPPNKGA
jgi:hypothetical protein